VAVSPGTKLSISEKLSAWVVCSASSPTTEMLSGVSCAIVSRLVAVMTISEISPACCAFAEFDATDSVAAMDSSAQVNGLRFRRSRPDALAGRE
jgi:hypothetical protein